MKENQIDESIECFKCSQIKANIIALDCNHFICINCLAKKLVQVLKSNPLSNVF